MQKTQMDMCQGPLFGKMISFTVPVILTGILQLLFNAADLVVVGRFCGSVSVAAVGATGSVINLIVNLFIGLSVGGSVTVSQGIGAGDDEGVHRTVHTAIPMAVISGLVLTVIGVSCSHIFLQLMGTPSDVIGLSTLYMRIYFCGIIPTMVYNYGAAILRAAGDTKGPLYFLGVSGILNVVLNVIFVTVFHLDVAGVALATAVSQTLSAVLVVLALMKREDACRLNIKQLRIYKKPLVKMVKVGVPAGIQGSLFSISNVIIQSSINSFGSVVMSGNAAAGNIEGFVYITINSFHQTALNFTGQNYGAGLYKRIHKILGICLASVTVVGLAVGALFQIFARPLLSIYITDSAEAIGYGVVRMTIICLTYFICGLMDVTTGVIRGMGSSFATMLITVIGVCVFRIVWVFTIFQIPQYHTLVSLYVSYPISWLITFAAQLVVYFVLCRKRENKTGVLVE